MATNKQTSKRKTKESSEEETAEKSEPVSTQEKLWFGVKPWIIVVGAVVLLILLFAPLFSATKMVTKTETIMTTVTTEEPVTVNREDNVKVYVGWMKIKAQSTTPTQEYVMIPGPTIIGGGNTSSDNNYAYAYQGQQHQQTYSYYPYYSYSGSQTVTTTKVDVSDEIVEVKYVSAPDNKWDISLISRDGTEKIIRDVTDYDLTKTGSIKVEVTETQMKTTSSQVPKEITNEIPTQIRVSLVQLIFGNY